MRIDDEEAAQNGSAAAISRQPSGPDAGRRRTETMLATSGVGFGGASSGQNVAAGGLWENSASAPLACLLYAASPLGNNQGMPWVLRAVGTRGDQQDDEKHPGEIELPSWKARPARRL